MDKKQAKYIFGQNLKRLRTERGMSQEELAHAMGFKNRSSINKIELGKNDMPRSMVLKAAEALGVSPLDLFKSDLDYIIQNINDLEIDADTRNSIKAAAINVRAEAPALLVEKEPRRTPNPDTMESVFSTVYEDELDEIMSDIKKLTKKRRKLVKAYVRGLLDAQEADE